MHPTEVTEKSLFSRGTELTSWDCDLDWDLIFYLDCDLDCDLIFEKQVMSFLGELAFPLPLAFDLLNRLSVIDLAVT